MAENSSKLVCQGCGEVFTEFLQDMADHNETVVCPKCGQVHERRLGNASDSQSKGH
jgi:putative FmdB family regulatory protein